MPVVTLEHVSKHFGAVRAVNDLNLTVEAGEIVAFLGTNGAGKTTSVSLMLGLCRPTTGQVRLFGFPLHHRRARSRIGVMLQESGVQPLLRVGELVDLFRSYYSQPLARGNVIASTGLAQKEQALAGTLSGGQRQRLCFALAICGDPDALFLDEPTVGLDVTARRQFWHEVGGFVRAGKTIILTTHYLDEVDAEADRVVVIHHGQLVVDDTPKAIKARGVGKRVSFDTDTSLSTTDFDRLSVYRLELMHQHVRFLSSEPKPCCPHSLPEAPRFVTLK